MSNTSDHSRTLGQWVEYIQGLHHRQIELSLERVREVYQRLLPQGLNGQIITLSGTNGKGSTAELLASIYRQAGHLVGKYTSPHLVSFNERINIDGNPVDEGRLLESFERVEAVRGETPITFFEYGTLVAIDLFHQANVDVAIMEVGLGGRLDAVNILDANVSIITSISIDHTSWLGDTIEKIAFEKAGIARADKPLLVGIVNPPRSIVEHASNVKATLQTIEKNFSYSFEEAEQGWSWQNGKSKFDSLPLPYSQAGVQLSNCSLALQAVSLLDPILPVTEQALREGVKTASVFGRCQVIQEKPLIVLDVSHNETSVSRLAAFVGETYSGDGQVVAVCGMLRDKEIAVSLQQISPLVGHWCVADIHNERGAKASEIETEINTISTASVICFDRVELAYEHALSTLTEHDCLLVFGSFHIAGDILALLDQANA